MRWTHKNIEIEVDNYGDFVFYFCDKRYENSTLSEAKEEIEELTQEYYNFTNSDYNCMLKKLNKREREFVNAICKELGEHENNSYCECGVHIEFNCDFSAINNKTKL